MVFIGNGSGRYMIELDDDDDAKDDDDDDDDHVIVSGAVLDSRDVDIDFGKAALVLSFRIFVVLLSSI